MNQGSTLYLFGACRVERSRLDRDNGKENGNDYSIIGYIQGVIQG